MIYVSAAVEGMVDEAVVRHLVSEAGGTVNRVFGKNGKRPLLRAVRGYNMAAQQGFWLVLVDLDRDGDCAPDVLSS